METLEHHLRAFDKIVFPRRVTDGNKVFAEAGDTGMILKWWPVSNIYTVLNDIERAEGYLRFDCDHWDVISREKEPNDNSTLF